VLTHADVLRRGASSWGRRVAVSFAGRDVTYAELDALTNRLARGLLAAGLAPGERVVWSDDNHLDYLLLYYATAKAAMVFSPLNPRATVPEVERAAALLEPQLLVAGPDAAVLSVDLGVRTVVHAPDGDWPRLFADGDGAVDPVDENSLHEVVFTSGTTGQAKGVMRSQRKRIIDSMCAALAYQLTRDDHMLFFAPQFHVGGGAAAGQVIVQGGRVTILPGFEPEAVAASIGAGATYMLGVPAHYSLLFESGALSGTDTTTMRGCFVGGSVAARHVFDSIVEVFPRADIVHGYGSTESGPHTTAVRGQPFLDHYGTLGLPIPGTEVRVVDRAGIDMGPDEPGELWVRAEAVMDGYLGRPDLTAEVLAPGGWLRTGDVVRRDRDGYCYLVDRLKEMIITGGENVYPSEVEAALMTHPQVLEVAVIGIPDPVYEERVVAFVRLHPSSDTTAAALVELLRAELAPHKIPRRIDIVDDFPRTPMGKIAKHELRVQHGSVFDGGVT
jgi:fatty-acyl-CoA synthase